MDYALLVLVCATAAVAGLVEVLLVPRYIGSLIFPIAVPLGVLTAWGLPRLGFFLTRRVSGAALPLLCWMLPVLILTFWPRPAGDVVVEGGNAEQWVAFTMIVLGAVIGFRVVVVDTVPAKAPSARPRPQATPKA